MHVYTRWLVRRDMDDVVAIESESSPYPATHDEILALLRERNIIGMVAESSYRVAGYCVYEVSPERITLLQLAVAQHTRRKGVGTVLLEKLKRKIDASETRFSLDVNVRETNLPGQLWLRNRGLRGVCVNRRYFADSGEDAFLMRYTKESSRE